MEYKKSDMYLQMETGKNTGWTEMKPPKDCLDCPDTILPAPMPTPPVVDVPDADADCGYCVTVGMSYVPMQKWNKVYEAEEGLQRGTIFADLDYPFMGKGDCGK